MTTEFRRGRQTSEPMKARNWLRNGGGQRGGKSLETNLESKGQGTGLVGVRRSRNGRQTGH